MKYLVLLISLLLVAPVHASRVIEIEDYYSNKVTDFIKSRYPRVAFSISVKAIVEEEVNNRNQKQDTLALPYMDGMESKAIGFWEQKDIPLGTLISYVKSISVKVDIDRNFTLEEIQQFKSEMSEYLKLSDVYDRLEISQRQWQSPWSIENSGNQIVLIMIGILLLAIVFFVVFQSGIRSLIKGLAQPLSEIGKSAENVANTASAVRPSSNNSQSGFAGSNSQHLDVQNSKQIISEIKMMSSFIGNPNPDLIRKIEKLGQEDPQAMGALLKEVEVEDLKSLVSWGRGEWWRQAITQPGSLSENSFRFFNEITTLSRKSQLLPNNSEFDDFQKIIARLSIKEFGQLLEGASFEQAEPILRLTPQEVRVSVGKYLYPGQWAQLLKDSGKGKKSVLLADVKKKYSDKALKICPLIESELIEQYFEDAEMVSFLDHNSTKDEREVYRALDETSWIKQNRRPFYSILQEDKNILEKLVSETHLDQWALAFTCCDSDEQEQLLVLFTERQRFLLKNAKKQYLLQPPQQQDVAFAKREIINICNQIKQFEKSYPSAEINNEIAA